MFSMNICSAEESTESIDCLLYVDPLNLRINIIFDKARIKIIFAAGDQSFGMFTNLVSMKNSIERLKML